MKECSDKCPMRIHGGDCPFRFCNASTLPRAVWQEICLYTAVKEFQMERAQEAWGQAYYAFNEAVREFNEKCKEPGVEMRFDVTWGKQSCDKKGGE
jgi:hypothetical protein